MSCLPTYNGKRYKSLKQLIKENGLEGSLNNRLSGKLSNGHVYGKYKDALITLMEDNGMIAQNTDRHEAMHFICDMMLTNAEYKAVLQAAKGLMERQGRNISDVEALEYIAENFETYRSGNKEWLGNVLSGFIGKLEKANDTMIKYAEVLDNLFYSAETGVYAKRGVVTTGKGNINNDNVLYKKVDNDYTKEEALVGLNRLFDNSFEAVRRNREVGKKYFNISSRYGRFIVKNSTTLQELAQKYYDNLTDKNTLAEMQKLSLTIDGKSLTLKEIFSHTGTTIGRKHTQFIENLRNGKVNITDSSAKNLLSFYASHTISGMQFSADDRIAIEDLAFQYVLASQAQGKAKDVIPLKTHLQAILPAIDVDEVLSGLATDANHNDSWANVMSFDSFVNDDFKDIIESISYTYSRGSILETRHISWNQYKGILVGIVGNLILGNTAKQSAKSEAFRVEEKVTFGRVLEEMKIWSEGSKSPEIRLMCKAILDKFSLTTVQKESFTKMSNEDINTIVKNTIRERGILLDNNMSRAVAIIDEMINPKSRMHAAVMLRLNNDENQYKAIERLLVKRKHEYLDAIVAMANSIVSLRPNKIVKMSKYGKKSARILEMLHTRNLDIRYKLDTLGADAIAMVEVGGTNNNNENTETFSRSETIISLRSREDLNLNTLEVSKEEITKNERGRLLSKPKTKIILKYKGKNITEIYDAVGKSKLDNDLLVQTEEYKAMIPYDGYLLSALDILYPGYFTKTMLEKITPDEKLTMWGAISDNIAFDKYNQAVEEFNEEIKEKSPEAYAKQKENIEAIKSSFITLFPQYKKINGKNYIISANSAGISYIIHNSVLPDSTASYIDGNGNALSKTICHNEQTRLMGYGNDVAIQEAKKAREQMLKQAFEESKTDEGVVVKRNENFKIPPLYQRGMNEQNTIILNPLLHRRTGSLASLSTFDNNGMVKEWDKMTERERLSTFFYHILPNFAFKEDGRYNVLISHTGDRNNTYIMDFQYPPYSVTASGVFGTTVTLHIGAIGGSVAQLVEYNRNIYQDHKDRLKGLGIAVNANGELTSNGKVLTVEDEEAKLIRMELTENLDYKIKNGIFVKGNAGTDPLFGADQWADLDNVVWNEDNEHELNQKEINDRYREKVKPYYDRFMKYVDANFADFLTLLKMDSKVPISIEKIQAYKAYFISHLLINESFAYLTRGTIEMHKDMNDYVKRGMGASAPVNSFNMDTTIDGRPGIGPSSNIVVMEDLPLANRLFNGESRNGATDGLTIQPFFYRLALKNSAGGDLGFIGNGAIKTMNHNFDFTNGILHYMKCSEMNTDYMLYNTTLSTATDENGNVTTRTLGQEIYRSLLDKDIQIGVEKRVVGRAKDGSDKIQETPITINPYNKWESILSTALSTKEGKENPENAFYKANIEFLNWLWHTKIGEDKKVWEKGERGGNVVVTKSAPRLYDMVGHKIVFHSASKAATRGLNDHNSFAKNEDGSYDYSTLTFGSLRDNAMQTISNKNYGLQTNKRQSTQAQNKPIMSQFAKIIGSYSINTEAYRNMDTAKAEKIIEMIGTMNKSVFKNGEYDMNAIKNFFGNKLVMSKQQSGEPIANIQAIVDAKGSLEAVKREVVNAIIGAFNNVVKPTTKGGIYVQQPLLFFNDVTGKARQLDTFGYMKEDGTEYTDIASIQADVLTNANVKIRMQEAVMAFPYASKFGVKRGTSLAALFKAGEESLYFDNKQYAWNTEANQWLPTEAKKDFKKRIEKLIGGDVEMTAEKAREALQNFHDDAINSILKERRVQNEPVKEETSEDAATETERTYKRESLVDLVTDYFWDLNNSLNIYALRIPTTNASCGFPTRIAAFHNAAENTIFTNPAKSILDGSDYDIDELNVYLNEHRTGKNKFASQFFQSIMQYYGNAKNASAVLSQITTANLIAQAEESRSRRGIMGREGRPNTITHQIINQTLNQDSKNLVGYMVNIGIDFANIMSTMNTLTETERAGQDWINNLGIFKYDSLKNAFFSVTSELVNGATDNANIGGALSVIGVSKYSAPLVAGLCLNLDSKMLYDYTLKKYADSLTGDNNFEEPNADGVAVPKASVKKNFDLEYGVVFDEQGDIISVSNKYAFLMLDSILNMKSVSNAIARCNHTDNIFFNGKRGKLYEKSVATEETEAFQEEILRMMYQGEGLRRAGRLDIDNITPDMPSLENAIREIASYLNVIDDENNTTIDKLKALLKGGYKKATKDDCVRTSSRYSTSSSLEAGVAENLDLRFYVANNATIRNALLGMITEHEIAKAALKSEQLQAAITDVVLRENRKAIIYKNDQKVLAKHVDKFMVGHAIKNLSDEYAIVKIDNKRQYDLRKAIDRDNFVRQFGSILTSLKNKYSKNNMFLNYIKNGSLPNGTILWGIESCSFLPPQLKVDLTTSINAIYQDAIMPTETATVEQGKKILAARETLKALEFIALLTHGNVGGRDNMLSLLPRYVQAELESTRPKLDKTVDSFISNIKKNGINDIDFSFMLKDTDTYIRGTYSLSKEDHDHLIDPDEDVTNDTRSEISEDSVERAVKEEEIDLKNYDLIPLSLNDAAANLPAPISGKNRFNPEERVLILSPYPKDINMYGVNNRLSPVVVNVPSLELPGKYLRQVKEGAEVIHITKSDSYIMRQNDTRKLLNTPRAARANDAGTPIGYGVNIMGEAYMLTAEATEERKNTRLINNEEVTTVDKVMHKYTLTKMPDGKAKAYKALWSYEGLEYSEHIKDTKRFTVFMERIQKVFPNVQIKQMRLGANAELASVSNGAVIVNLDRFSPSSMIHEMTHVFTFIVKEYNPGLYQQLRSEALWHIDNNSEIYQHVKKEYSGIISNIGSTVSVSEDLIYEIIGNIVHKTYAKAMDTFFIANDVSVETRGRVQKSVSNRGIFARFMKNAGNTISKLFGINSPRLNASFDITQQRSMTIQDLGQMIYDAIATGRTLSYVSSSELAMMSDSPLYAVNSTNKIKTASDLAATLMKENNRFSGMTDVEKVDAIYKIAMQQNGNIRWGDFAWDLSTLSEADAKTVIEQQILPKYQTNMATFKTNLVGALTYTTEKRGGNISIKGFTKSLGTRPNDADKSSYSEKQATALTRLMGYGKNKKYVKMSDLAKDNTIIENIDLKQIFRQAESLVGFDPVVAIEYNENGTMIISLYDFIDNSPNATGGPGISRTNLLNDFGVDEREAKLRGFNMSNSVFDVRSLLMTMLANKLQQTNKKVQVREMSITKIQQGTDTVETTYVNPWETSRSISFMGKNEAFMQRIDNKDMIDIFNTETDNIQTNAIDYFSMLYSHYTTFGMLEWDANGSNTMYDAFLARRKDQIRDGKLTNQEKATLIKWRMEQLTNIPYENMTTIQFNELKLLMEAYKQYNESSFDFTQMNKSGVIDRLNKWSAQFDIRSPEIQEMRKALIKARNKTEHELRKYKKETRDIWEHFSKEYGNVGDRVHNAFHIYKELYATVKAKDANGNMRDAYIGRIMFTTDGNVDKEFAQQAQQKIAEGKLTQEDLAKADKLCDTITELYIKMIKHQHRQMYGDLKIKDATGSRIDPPESYWMEQLTKRGYKKGMIPIVPKHYMSKINKEEVKRLVGIDIAEQGNDYALIEDERGDIANDNIMDEISNIFMSQIAATPHDIDNQLSPENIGSFFDPKYGAKARFKYLGLSSDEMSGELIFFSNGGESQNSNINMDLEFCFNVFNMSMNKKVVYEEDALPVINTIGKVLKFSEMFSIEKDVESIRDMASAIMQLAVEGKNANVKNFGKEFFGSKHSLGQILGSAGNAMVGMQMIGNINVGIQSMLINNYKLAIESLVGANDEDSFIGGVKSNVAASAWVSANLGKAFDLAYDLHIIQSSEQSSYQAGYKGAVSNKNLFTSFVANVMNWATDSKTRTNIMVAVMKKDGCFDAMKYEDGKWTYDDTKDRRFFNEDGTQTANQKILYEQMIENHKIAGIEIIVDANGNEHLSQPYDWEEANAIKEYADKRIIGSYDNLTKTLMGVEVVGKMGSMYFNWFMAAADNIMGKKHTVETIFKYKVDEGGRVFRDKMEVEGWARTFGRLTALAITNRSFDSFRNMSTMEKQNMRRFFFTVAMFSISLAIYHLLAADDDDPEDIGIIDKRNRLLRNVKYATDSLFIINDVLERMKNPFPLLDVFGRVVDDNGWSFASLKRWIPFRGTYKTFYDIANDYKK